MSGNRWCMTWSPLTWCACVIVQVPLAQKWMIAKANLKGRPVIVSGQILATMVDRWAVVVLLALASFNSELGCDLHQTVNSEGNCDLHHL